MTIGANLIHNPDCDQSKVPGAGASAWASSTRFATTGDRSFAVYNSPFDGPGDYVLTVTHEAAAGYRVRCGDSGYHALPATSGGSSVVSYTITDPETFNALSFDDPSEEDVITLRRVDNRKVS